MGVLRGGVGEGFRCQVSGVSSGIGAGGSAGIGEPDSAIKIGEGSLKTLGRWVVYGVLVLGAVVFSFPFIWMAATSVKVDREMQAKGIRVVPLTPRPRAKSPYIDETYFDEIEGPLQAELLPRLEALIGESNPEMPGGVDRAVAEKQLARGLYDVLMRRVPGEVWEGRTKQPDDTWGPAGDPVDTVAAAAEKLVEEGALAKVLDRIYRRMLIGPIRLRTYDREECVLVTGTNSVAAMLQNRSPDVVKLTDVMDRGQPYALVSYDFAGDDRAVLEGTFTVPDGIDLARLHRIQVPLRPDDTWHELWLTVEAAGKRYSSVRAGSLANFEAVMASWQPAGSDDSSTKIKTWIRLEDAGRVGTNLAANRLRLHLELRQVSPFQAWRNKLRANYYKVFDHMPFWRYLRVSLFLVVANIVLTLVFSSVVAYAFARLRWPGREFCFMLMLSTMMIPFQVIMIPRFLIWKNLGAYNTLTPLWLGPVFGNAFFVFLLRQFMKGIPRDLEDAARIDGCGFLRIYFYIILPLIKPSLAAIAIFTFIGTWNNFMGPLLYIADQRLYPLAFGLYAFSVQVGNNPALTMAGSFLMTVPVIVIFFFAQKYFIQGITLTGMKQ